MMCQILYLILSNTNVTDVSDKGAGFLHQLHYKSNIIQPWFHYHEKFNRILDRLTNDT